MANLPSEVVNSPVGDLEWVIINGEGKKDLKGNPKFSAQVVMNEETYEAFKAKVMAFWEANKPKGVKKPKSLGLYEHQIPTGEKDEDGDNIYEKTGNFVVQFSTGTTYKDGKAKVIQVFGPKGQELSLGDKKIGNGSRGRLQGVMAIYTVQNEGTGKVIDGGVTFYLNGVQLSKFVPYVGGPNFDEIEDDVEDDGLDSLNDGMDALEPEQSESEKPRL